VTQNLRNLKRLFAVMRMVSAILNSPYLHVEPYVCASQPYALPLIGATGERTFDMLISLIVGKLVASTDAFDLDVLGRTVAVQTTDRESLGASVRSGTPDPHPRVVPRYSSHYRCCHHFHYFHHHHSDYSAELVATICSKYAKQHAISSSIVAQEQNTHTLDERYAKYRFGGAYQNLQPRVTKTLLHAFLDPKKPLTTHYGAIVGLSKLVRPRRLFASLVQLHIPSLPHSLTHHYRSGPKCHSSAAVAQHWLVRAHVDADSPGARGCHQATRGTKVSRRFVGTTAKPNIHRSIFEYSPCSLFIHWDLSVVASCRYLFATSA